MDKVTITLHPDIADEVRRLVRDYRRKDRTGLSSYARSLLLALEDGIEEALKERT